MRALRILGFLVLIAVPAGLWFWWQPKPPPAPTVTPPQYAPGSWAIVPLEPASSSNADAQLAARLHEDLLDDLTSSVSFRFAVATSEEDACRLRAEFLITGSVRRAGGASEAVLLCRRACSREFLWEETVSRSDSTPAASLAQAIGARIRQHVSAAQTDSDGSRK